MLVNSKLRRAYCDGGFRVSGVTMPQTFKPTIHLLLEKVHPMMSDLAGPFSGVVRSHAGGYHTPPPVK